MLFRQLNSVGLRIVHIVLQSRCSASNPGVRILLILPHKVITYPHVDANRWQCDYA